MQTVSHHVALDSSLKSLSGWWFQLVSTPLQNMKVSWDDYSIYDGKIKNVPNHQPVIYEPQQHRVRIDPTIDELMWLPLAVEYGEILLATPGIHDDSL